MANAEFTLGLRLAQVKEGSDAPVSQLCHSDLKTQLHDRDALDSQPCPSVTLKSQHCHSLLHAAMLWGCSKVPWSRKKTWQQAFEDQDEKTGHGSEDFHSTQPLSPPRMLCQALLTYKVLFPIR